MATNKQECKEMILKANAQYNKAKTKAHNLDLERNSAGLAEQKMPDNDGAKKGDAKKKARGV